MFHRNDDADIDGTNFYNVEVTASLETMTHLFGPPRKNLCEKTKHEWIFEGVEFNVAVYDYKYDGSISGVWHVGATDSLKARKFLTWFKHYVVDAERERVADVDGAD